MVAIGTAIRTGLRLAGRIDKKYNINKIFVEKYVPPGYRKTVNRIFDVAGTLGGGLGIYNTIQSLYAPDTPGNDAIPQIQRKRFTPSKSYKTRYRQTKRDYCRNYRNKRPYSR